VKQVDTFGRKKIIIATGIAQIIIVFALYFARNLYLIFALMVLAGIAVSKNLILFIYLPELTPEKYRVFVGSYGYTIDSFLPIITVIIYFAFIGDNWTTIYIVPMVFSIIFVVLAFFIPESPKYLYARKMYSELRKNLDFIAKINKTKMPENYYIDTEYEELQKSESNQNESNHQYILII
jgi:MFS family permease